MQNTTKLEESRNEIGNSSSYNSDKHPLRGAYIYDKDTCDSQCSRYDLGAKILR